jgi:hypothetical protein
MKSWTQVLHKVGGVTPDAGLNPCDYIIMVIVIISCSIVVVITIVVIIFIITSIIIIVVGSITKW